MSLYPHRMAVQLALRRLSAKPLSTTLSALVIAIALALPALGYALIDNLAGLARGVSGKPELSVFLKNETTREQGKAIEARLQTDTRIAAIRFVPREEALKELSAHGGFADVATALPENPLPDAFVLEPKDDKPASFEVLRQMLTAFPEVAYVQLDSDWVERIQALIQLGRTIVILLAGLLGTALVIVTFNTIRLQILTQRHEISVSLLLGATRQFVRRPFLYFGLLQGLLGGLLAWGLVVALLMAIGPSAQALARKYSIVLDIAAPKMLEVAVLLVFAALLGWLGAALSVRRHLHDGAVD